MKIRQINNNTYHVIGHNEVVVFVAKNQAEAIGYIKWKTRGDSATDEGNIQDCQDCN